jgi:hypothetical protein
MVGLFVGCFVVGYATGANVGLVVDTDGAIVGSSKRGGPEVPLPLYFTLSKISGSRPRMIANSFR